jgi:RHS repeat-associated protein
VNFEPSVVQGDPQGNPPSVDNMFSADPYANRFLYTGREFLKEANLYDYRNRIYSSELGRFIQTDPIRFDAGDVNFYRYVANNPVNAADPLGLAYFASSGLAALGGVWLGPFSKNPIYFNTELSHEHTFFEDRKSPADIGYGPNGKFSGENPLKYRKNDGGNDDCVMRKAVDAVNWSCKYYFYVGRNCQS